MDLVAKIDVVAFFFEQESSTLREIPVVIMSSENILARIDRYAFSLYYLSLVVLDARKLNKIDHNFNSFCDQNKIQDTDLDTIYRILLLAHF